MKGLLLVQGEALGDVVVEAGGGRGQVCWKSDRRDVLLGKEAEGGRGNEENHHRQWRGKGSS